MCSPAVAPEPWNEDMNQLIKDAQRDIAQFTEGGVELHLELHHIRNKKLILSCEIMIYLYKLYVRCQFQFV